MSVITVETAGIAHSALIAELGARTFTEAFAAENRYKIEWRTPVPDSVPVAAASA